MSYEKQTWQRGDVITANKLNHMEDGIASSGGGGGVLVVNEVVTVEDVKLDKTWQEIYDAPVAVYVSTADEGALDKTSMLITAVYEENGAYTVTIGDTNFVADTTNGYPVRDGGK